MKNKKSEHLQEESKHYFTPQDENYWALHSPQSFQRESGKHLWSYEYAPPSCKPSTAQLSIACPPFVLYLNPVRSLSPVIPVTLLVDVVILYLCLFNLPGSLVIWQIPPFNKVVNVPLLIHTGEKPQGVR